ncbi:MAG: hypothetical protein CL670_12940 [Balneola sp.]|jgi:hypothetical protein|nr:hypothetical protein [Balneola sp.]MBE80055.1 hypothetical protein [Balneola sp.]HBX67253.1 hypothetical protein [Balneolaceae bacterium]|tara:strand:- start:177 stop:536 length:360 start_codon:yes stop_codon:yes gene_type:complete
MTTKQTIEEFFEEQFQNTSQFFLYKDKQLLKDGKYQEFAHEQLDKAKNIFWSVGAGLLMATWYGITSFINYGTDPTVINLAMGLFCWFGFMAGLLFSCKEYYTIKSSMTLLIKLMDEKE